LACLDNQANLLWASGPKNRIGKGGNYLLADGLIYAMSDNGKLFLIDANQPKYALLDAAQVIPDGQDSWGPMALADGRLLARDLTRLVCLDVGASK
jgi:outer membrane protein assembly factor BamB